MHIKNTICYQKYIAYFGLPGQKGKWYLPLVQGMAWYEKVRSKQQLSLKQGVSSTRGGGTQLHRKHHKIWEGAKEVAMSYKKLFGC